MYDLRFPKSTLSSSTRTNQQAITTPVLEYHDYRNEFYLGLGFDIDLDTGVVAVGELSNPPFLC